MSHREIPKDKDLKIYKGRNGNVVTGMGNTTEDNSQRSRFATPAL